MYNILALGFCGLYAILNVIAASIIKFKLQVFKIDNFKSFLYFFEDIRIIFAVCLIMCSMYCSMKALSIAVFSYVVPMMTAFNFILTVVIGIIVFKDHLTVTGYSGIFLILLGILILSISYGR